jgi:hypothetical protein
VRFVLERVMRTRYRIDDFQECYFVLQDLDELLALARVDFGPVYAQVAGARPSSPAPCSPATPCCTAARARTIATAARRTDAAPGGGRCFRAAHGAGMWQSVGASRRRWRSGWAPWPWARAWVDGLAQAAARRR